MFTICRHIELDAGHRVPYHASHCRYVHGHRYRVEVALIAPGLVPPESRASDAGMVLDFGVIKGVLLDAVHTPCDHHLLLWEQDPLVQDGRFRAALEDLDLWRGVTVLPCIPTAEGLAEYWGGRVAEFLAAPGGAPERWWVLHLAVHETPSSVATWRPLAPDAAAAEAQRRVEQWTPPWERHVRP